MSRRAALRKPNRMERLDFEKLEERNLLTALLGTIVPPSTVSSAFGSSFGGAVAASSSYVVVGAPGADIGNNSDAGQAFVFDAESRALLHTLSNPAPSGGENYGAAVAVAGNRIVVGAWGDTVGTAFGAGRAFIYNAVTGQQIAAIDNPGPIANDTFGFSVAASGNFIAIGEPRHDGVSNNQGAVHLYNASTGAFVRTINHPEPVQFGSELFGWSLSMAGDMLVVGQGNFDRHKAYVFNATTGALVRTISDPVTSPSNAFGTVVATDGVTIAVGAPRSDTSATDSGSVYLFNASTGALARTILNPLPAANDYFGAAIALADSTVAIGAYGSDVGGNDIGAVYIFDTASGILGEALSNPTPNNLDQFGRSLALAAGRIVVGSKDDDVAGSDQGAVHVFGPAPFDPTLSSSLIDENQPGGTVVGILSGGPSATGPLTFQLVAGTGADDNASFTIVGNELRTAAPLNFESGATRSIRIEGMNAAGTKVSKAFAITVGDLNDNPLAVSLSNAMVAELQSVGTRVGTFTTSDPDAIDSFTYSLVPGIGADDNSAFAIVGNELRTASEVDFERKQLFRIRVRSIDAGGLTVENEMLIHVTNVNEPTQDEQPRFDLRLVADVNSAIQSSTPTEAIEIDGVLYFVAATAEFGSELWRTDGTLSGTQRLTDLVTNGGSFPRSLTELDGDLFFVADYQYLDPLAPPGGVGVLRTGLYRTDGTASGVVLVKDLDQLPSLSGGVSDAQPMTVIAGRLFLITGDPTFEQKLWVSDGTSTGTAILASVPSGGAISPTTKTATLGNLFLFNRVTDATSGAHSLWRSDGTVAGTFQLRAGESGFSGVGQLDPAIVVVGSTAFFVSKSLDKGMELWKTDGSLAGTQLVKDIYVGFDGSSPTSLTAAGSTLYFAAETGFAGTGRELWKSDGTAAGTVLVKDIQLGSSSGIDSFNFEMVAWNGSVYFSANDGLNGVELWTSDGSPVGTQMVFNAGSFGAGLHPQHLTPLDGWLAFTTGSFSSLGAQLWKVEVVDGTATLLADIDGPMSSSGTIAELLADGSRLFFRANDGSTGSELYVSDGTAQGTSQLDDLNPGGGSGALSIIAAGLDGVVFQANDGASGIELGVSNGEPSGTRLLDVAEGTLSADIGEAVDVAGTLYFVAQGDLWKSDGTASGTALVKDFSAFANPGQLTNIAGTLYFVAEGALSQGRELWKSDGTAAGTVLVKDILPGSGSSDIESLTSFDGALYFVADDGVHGKELWRSFGLPETTLLFREFAAGTADRSLQLLPLGAQLFVLADEVLQVLNQANGFDVLSSQSSTLMPWGNLVYFSGYTPQHGWELWRTDGTQIGTYLVKDLLLGPESSYPGGGANVASTESGGAALESKLVFRALAGVDNAQLFATNGTSSGTTQLTSLPPVSGASGTTASFTPTALTSVGDLVFFEAYDAATGRELWVTNGTASGTRLVGDLRPGPAPDPLDVSSTVGFNTLEDLTSFHGLLFFSTAQGTPGVSATGRELWYSDGSGAGSGVAIDIFPGSTSGNPRELTISGNRLYVAANTRAYGQANSSARSGELFRLNQAPTLQSAADATTAGMAVTIPLIGHDADGEALVYEIVAAPQHGQGSINGSTLVYVPNAGYVGVDSFTIRAFDGSLYSSMATVEVGVTPIANSASFATSRSMVAESEGVHRAIVVLDHPAAADLFLPYSIEGSAAVDAGNAPLGQLFIPAGATTGEIIVALSDDDSYSSLPQLVEISLLGNPSIALGAGAQQVLEFIENDPLPTIAFGSWQTVNESNDTIAIDVMLSAPSDQLVTATISLSHLDSATPNVDFISKLTHTVEFLPGQMKQSILVRLLEDVAPEQREVIRAQVASVTGATVTTDPLRFRHFTWIEDNDTSQVTISSGVNLTSEGEVISLQAVRSGGNLAGALSAPVTVHNQGATFADYSLSSIVFQFAPGAATATIDITIQADGLDEPFEAFSVALDNSGGGFAIGDSPSSYIGIYDSDSTTVRLAIGATNAPGVVSPTSVNERHPHGASSWFIEVTASLSNPSAETISVPVVVSNSTVRGYAARGTDFQFSTADFVFAPGVTAVTRTLEIFDDIAVEGDELIRIALEPRPDQFFLRAAGMVDDGSLSKQIVIRDDDLGISLWQYFFRDGAWAYEQASTPINESAESLDLIFALNAPASFHETFYIDLGGTANRGADYTTPPLGEYGYYEVKFVPGQQYSLLSIPLVDDNIDELDESLKLGLYRVGNNGFEYGGAWSTTIVDNDSLPTVDLSPFKYAVYETSQVVFTAKLSHPSSESVFVTIDFVGSAQQGVDYEILRSSAPMSSNGSQRTLEFKPLQTTANITLRTLDVPSDRRISASIVSTVSAAKSPPRPLSISEFYKLKEQLLANNSIEAKVTGGYAAANIDILDLQRTSGTTPPPETNEQKVVYASNPGVIVPGTLAIETSPSTAVVPIGAIGVQIPGVLPNGIQAVAASPGTLLISTGYQGRLVGSTVFFDANFNDIVDFLDLNENGRRDADEPLEPTATTDIDGSFALLISPDFDVDRDGVIGPGEGRLVLIGGVDASIGNPFGERLTAPVGFFAVTPLTTLVESLARRSGTDVVEAYDRVRRGLGLSQYDLRVRNPAYDLLAGDQLASDAYVRQVQVSSIAMAMASLLSGVSSLPVQHHAQDIFDLLADRLSGANITLDLGDVTLLRGLISAGGNRAGVALSAEVMQGAAELIALGTQRLQALRLPNFSTPTSLLNELARIKKVFQVDLATSLGDVGGGIRTIADVLSDYTGAQSPNFDSRVAQQTIEQVIPPVLGVSNGFLFEGDDGNSVMRFMVEILGDHDETVSVDFQTFDDSAAAGLDYLAAAGVLTWAPGDTSSRTIEVTIIGDGEFEPDETFGLQLKNSQHAAIRIAQGTGYLLNDDDLSYSAIGSETEPTKLVLYSSRDGIELLDGNNVVASGELADALSATLAGKAAATTDFVVDFSLESYRGDHYSIVGGSAADSLTIVGGRYEQIVHRVDGGGAGRQWLSPSNGDLVTIDWESVESFDIGASEVDTLVVVLPAGVFDAIIEDDDAEGMMRVRSGAAEFNPIVFTNPNSQLVIVATEASATVHVVSTDVEFLGTVTTYNVGDYNWDGQVDAADYTVWRDLQSTGGSLQNARADGNGDGVVDSGDYVVWKSHYGDLAPALILPPASAAVNAASSAISVPTNQEADNVDDVAHAPVDCIEPVDREALLVVSEPYTKEPHLPVQTAASTNKAAPNSEVMPLSPIVGDMGLTSLRSVGSHLIESFEVRADLSQGRRVLTVSPASRSHSVVEARDEAFAMLKLEDLLLLHSSATQRTNVASGELQFMREPCDNPVADSPDDELELRFTSPWVK